MLRASFNEGFEAPNLPTEYAPTAYFSATNIDPYKNAIIGEGPYAANANLAGNRSLKPTRTYGRHLGVVIDVPYVKGLSLTADYWNINEFNLVGTLSQAQILLDDQARLIAYSAKATAAGT